MSLKTVTVYALECDYCHARIPDRESGLVGWDTIDGINAELQDQYEQWGRHIGRTPLLHRLPLCHRR